MPTNLWVNCSECPYLIRVPQEATKADRDPFLHRYCLIFRLQDALRLRVHAVKTPSPHACRILVSTPRLLVTCVRVASKLLWIWFYSLQCRPYCIYRDNQPISPQLTRLRTWTSSLTVSCARGINECLSGRETKYGYNTGCKTCSAGNCDQTSYRFTMLGYFRSKWEPRIKVASCKCLAANCKIQ